MKERTPTWKCYLEIHEVTKFTDEEQEIINEAMEDLPRFTIDDNAYIVRFRLWADTQAEINAARTRLGKLVIQILNDRKK